MTRLLNLVVPLTVSDSDVKLLCGACWWLVVGSAGPPLTQGKPCEPEAAAMRTATCCIQGIPCQWQPYLPLLQRPAATFAAPTGEQGWS